MRFRKVYVIGAFFVLAALAGAAYFLGFFPAGISEVLPQVTGGAETMILEEETDRYTIDVKYPQFGIPEIDEQIALGVSTLIAEFKAKAETLPRDTRYGLDSTFDAVYVDEEVVSAWIAVTSYLGGAHPGTSIYGLNFDRTTGKEIVLSQALKLVNANLQQVADRATQILSHELGESFLPEGAAADSDNYRVFTINKDEVTFIFSPYQVAPYAAGPQGISFPRVQK